MKPLIGITCSGEPDCGRIFLNKSYAAAVSDAGGVPVLLPSLAGLEPYFLERVGGILLSGGGDIDPHFFGEEPLGVTGKISPDRDAFEIRLTRLALAAGLPVLGICRGIQVLNVAAGGTVYQDVTCAARIPLKHFQAAPRWHPTHDLDIMPGTRLSGLIGGVSARVNSFHHQAVNRLAGGFKVSARSADGVIEGIEAAEVYAVGVQFHPEDMYKRDRKFLKIFESLVAAAI